MGSHCWALWFQMYISCRLRATLATKAPDSQNKACFFHSPTFRWTRTHARTSTSTSTKYISWHTLKHKLCTFWGDLFVRLFLTWRPPRLSSHPPPLFSWCPAEGSVEICACCNSNNCSDAESERERPLHCKYPSIFTLSVSISYFCIPCFTFYLFRI